MGGCFIHNMRCKREAQSNPRDTQPIITLLVLQDSPPFQRITDSSHQIFLSSYSEVNIIHVNERE